MLPIMVEQGACQERLEQLGVRLWPVWNCGVSVFPWFYDQREVCYLIEGVAVVTPDEGAPVELGAGDLVIFPQGLQCSWEVMQPVRKHYRLG